MVCHTHAIIVTHSHSLSVNQYHSDSHLRHNQCESHVLYVLLDACIIHIITNIIKKSFALQLFANYRQLSIDINFLE